MYDAILFPSDPLNKRKVDPELEKEYVSAEKAGFNTILFDYMSWFEEEKIKLNMYPDECVQAVYRGWMMPSGQYKEFYNRLKDKNIHLINDPQEYENCHYFPNSYPLFEKDTAKILLFPLHQKIDIHEITDHFSKFMIKDYVKSVKGDLFPKYFDSSISQKEFDNWMKEFYKFRGNLISGGICIKEYLDLKKYDSGTNECRVFYLNHKILLINYESNNLSRRLKS